MDKIEIFCIVEGEDTLFSVKASRDESISTLKELIQPKRPAMKDVYASDLTLWHVSIPSTPKRIIKRRDLTDAEKANKEPENIEDPSITISEVFGTSLPKRTIHLIVDPTQAPVLTRTPSPPPAELETEAFHMRLGKIKQDFFQPGNTISDFLRMFVEGELSLPEADCCVKGLPKAWLRSSSFAQKSPRPALYLLHPTRPHQTTSTTTPPSVAALETISNFQNNDLITFFGVSGCGKTRAVVEMLAQTWGFYLNGKYCLSLNRCDAFTRDRWMLLQVCPGAFEPTIPDVFDSIFRALLDVYHGHIPAISFPNLKRLLQTQFHLVQRLLSSYASDSPPSKFLVVLDEAQTLSDHGKGYFMSHAESGDLRSILSPIIHGLRSISSNTQNYCVVTCGTGIGADELEVLLSSGGIGNSWEQVNR
ncbi:hypothetical protein BGZ79_000394 [Entomortierella chlamydospora]|nr:hypothetical protein BGZ79_000394 [Entomortierella chlamydospora]